MSIDKKQVHFRRLESMYQAAPVNAFLSYSISVSQGACRIETCVDGRFFHSGGGLHGGVYFKLLDDAAFFAANSLNRDVLLATVQFSVHFVRALNRGPIVVMGEVLQKTRHLITAESKLYDYKERLAAKGSGCFSVTQKKLADTLGYLEEVK